MTTKREQKKTEEKEDKTDGNKLNVQTCGISTPIEKKFQLSIFFVNFVIFVIFDFGSSILLCGSSTVPIWDPPPARRFAPPPWAMGDQPRLNPHVTFPKILVPKPFCSIPMLCSVTIIVNCLFLSFSYDVWVNWILRRVSSVCLTTQGCLMPAQGSGIRGPIDDGSDLHWGISRAQTTVKLFFSFQWFSP